MTTHSHTSQRVGKLEAAERQLREAVRMFFEERDAIAVHTLVSAAHQVLADLGRPDGYAGILRNPTIVKPGHEREVRDAIARAENFFKHADRDPSATVEFTPFLTEAFFLDAIQTHRMLTNKVIWEFGIFSVWFSSKYPDVIHDSEYKTRIADMVGTGIIDPDDKELWKSMVDVNPGGILQPT